jgi:hypothetical protein
MTIEKIEVVHTCRVHGDVGEDVHTFAGRRWCGECLRGVFLGGGVSPLGTELRRTEAASDGVPCRSCGASRSDGPEACWACGEQL